MPIVYNKILTVAIRLLIAEPRYAQKNAKRKMRMEITIIHGKLHWQSFLQKIFSSQKDKMVRKGVIPQAIDSKWTCQVRA